MSLSLGRTKLLLALLALGSGGACASSQRVVAHNNRELQQAERLIEQGELSRAAVHATGVLRSTEADPRRYAVQRLCATTLLSEIELRAGVAATNEPTAVEHLVRVHWLAARAREHLQLLPERQPDAAAVDERLPPNWARGTPEMMIERTAIAALASSARLGLASAAVLGRELDGEECEVVQAQLERLGIPPAARTWIHAERFAALEAAGDPRALAFGVAVLDAPLDSFPASRREHIARALTSGRSGWLVCPDDGEQFDPQLPVCTQCGRPRRSFRIVR